MAVDQLAFFSQQRAGMGLRPYPTHLREAAASLVARLHAAVGDGAAVRIFLPDQAGRLRQVATAGGSSLTGRPGTRRWVHHTGNGFRVPAGSRPGWALAVLPLLVAEERVGIVEIGAADQVLTERWEELQGMLALGSPLLREVRRGDAIVAEVEEFPEASLVRRMLGAASVEEALRTVARYYQRRFAVPAAALAYDSGAGQWVLVASPGMPPKGRSALRRDIGVVSGWGKLPSGEKDRLALRFREAAGAAGVEVLEARGGLVIVGGSTPELGGSLRVLRPVFERILRHLGIVTWAIRRNQSLDLAMACTLHELRGPLVGARAVLGELEASGTAGWGGDLLDRSRRELEHLISLVDTVLPWTAGTAELDARAANLARVVRDAVESCALEAGEDRIEVAAPDRLAAVVDATQMRGVVANLVRNALRYSPKGTKVRVSLEPSEDFATLTVRDDGPGIKAEERTVIFDPFARGEAGLRARNGTGLGLFMARRVVEAHRGDIWVEPSQAGATFKIRLPLTRGF